jgi:ActR/RegA family two-component response regulator
MLAANDLHGSGRPRLILAHPNEEYKAIVRRSFRRRNWKIHTAHSAEQVRQLARVHAPELIVLATELGDESGWLTCEKLRDELPTARIVLVANDPSYPLERFAHFVGAAALVSVHSAPAALLEVVEQPLGV